MQAQITQYGTTDIVVNGTSYSITGTGANTVSPLSYLGAENLGPSRVTPENSLYRYTATVKSLLSGYRLELWTKNFNTGVWYRQRTANGPAENHGILHASNWLSSRHKFKHNRFRLLDPSGSIIYIGTFY